MSHHMLIPWLTIGHSMKETFGFMIGTSMFWELRLMNLGVMRVDNFYKHTNFTIATHKFTLVRQEFCVSGCSVLILSNLLISLRLP